MEGNMKTYECIARSGLTGKQIVLHIRAYTASSARSDALEQARNYFGSGPVTIISVEEV